MSPTASIAVMLIVGNILASLPTHGSIIAKVRRVVGFLIILMAIAFAWEFA